MIFALLNVTGRADLDATMPALAAACEAKLADCAAAWSTIYSDVKPPKVRVVHAVSELTNDDTPVVFVVDVGDPGAEAFHTLSSTGLVYALVQADAHTPLSEAQQAAWHECAEALVDPRCDRYDADGFAVEVCDPLQNDPVMVGDITLSPFATPAWNLMGEIHPGTPTNSEGLALEAHQVRPGGYCMKSDGTELTAPGYRHAAAKYGWLSRRMKRHALLAKARVEARAASAEEPTT